MLEVSACERSTENTTSSAVNLEPSCQVTPWRNLNIQVVGEVCFHSVARPAIGFMFLSRTSSCS